MVRVRPISAVETVSICEVICSAEREVELEQMLCLLRECEINHQMELVPRYAWVTEIISWVGPYAKVKIREFGVSGESCFKDIFILRSCFSIPPELILYSHVFRQPGHYYSLASHFVMYLT